MDINDLKELVEPDVLADYLGLDYQDKGGRFLVLCPFHADKRLGSAFLHDGRFYCFSCGESADYVDLVRRVKGVSFPKAVKALADLAGVVWDGFSDIVDDNGYSKYRLNKEEIAMLRIPQSSVSLKKIYTASPEKYKEIVTTITLAEKERLENILVNYADRSSPLAYRICELYDGETNAQCFRNIKSEAKTRLRMCNSILERFE